MKATGSDIPGAGKEEAGNGVWNKPGSSGTWFNLCHEVLVSKIVQEHVLSARELVFGLCE